MTDDSTIVQVVACRPVFWPDSLSQLAPELLLPDIHPGSDKIACDGCGQLIYISPAAAEWRAMTTPPMQAMCITCAADRLAAAEGNGFVADIPVT